MGTYKRVRANKGTAGVDGQSIGGLSRLTFEQLYSSGTECRPGSYYPPAGRRVDIRRETAGLALQLPFCFEVRSLSGSLVSSGQEWTMRRYVAVDTVSRESDGDAGGFPELTNGSMSACLCLGFCRGTHVSFFWRRGMARCRIAAIMAKAASPGKRGRCQPCHDLLSL